MKKYLAFDIGGTHIKYGIVTEAGEVITHSHVDTEAYLGGKAIVSKVISIGERCLSQFTEVSGIAISSAGQVNFHTGTIIAAGDTIPGYKGLHIKGLVEAALQLPVEVRNDVDCAALCEQWKGEHQSKNFITLTIGTGVGGAIFINNELYSGHTFSAGEWGYMLVEGEQFEKVASLSALTKSIKQYKGDREWTGKEVFDLYDSGDEQVKIMVARFYKHLGIGISNLIYIFNPEKVVIGGGITGRGERFLAEVRTSAKQYTTSNIYENTEIVLAKHSNLSGMLGAVYHFMQQENNN